MSASISEVQSDLNNEELEEEQNEGEHNELQSGKSGASSSSSSDEEVEGEEWEGERESKETIDKPLHFTSTIPEEEPAEINGAGCEDATDRNDNAASNDIPEDSDCEVYSFPDTNIQLQHVKGSELVYCQFCMSFVS